MLACSPCAASTLAAASRMAPATRCCSAWRGAGCDISISERSYASLDKTSMSHLRSSLFRWDEDSFTPVRVWSRACPARRGLARGVPDSGADVAAAAPPQEAPQKGGAVHGLVLPGPAPPPPSVVEAL